MLRPNIEFWELKINYAVSISTPSIINTIILGATVFVLPKSRKAWRRAAFVYIIEYKYN
jgi:hypothetical protein